MLVLEPNLLRAAASDIDALQMLCMTFCQLKNKNCLRTMQMPLLQHTPGILTQGAKYAWCAMLSAEAHLPFNCDAPRLLQALHCQRHCQPSARIKGGTTSNVRSFGSDCPSCKLSLASGRDQLHRLQSCFSQAKAASCKLCVWCKICASLLLQARGLLWDQPSGSDHRISYQVLQMLHVGILAKALCRPCPACPRLRVRTGIDWHAAQCAWRSMNETWLERPSLSPACRSLVVCVAGWVDTSKSLHRIESNLSAQTASGSSYG